MRIPILAALAGAAVAAAPAVRAADHAEAPATRADPAADLADLYAWHEGRTLVTVLTFDGLKVPAPGQQMTFDEGVVYTVHIDNDDDFISDIDIDTSFFTAANGNRGVLVRNLPGADRDVTGFVETGLNVDGQDRVFAGLVDDPFFFDLQGFQETLMTGTLSFDGTRDSVAGLNATAIVLRMPVRAALRGGSTLNIWATTAR